MPILAKEHVDIPTQDIVSWLFDEKKYDWGKPLFIDASDTSNSISASQARSIIRKLVAGFKNAGLKQGDTVCLHSFNDIYYTMIVLGVIAAGGVWTGTNPAYTSHELSHHISVTKAKFFIMEEELMKPMLEGISSAKIKDPKIFIFDRLGSSNSKHDHPSWNALLQNGERDWVRFDDERTARNTTAMLLTTSGTTGLPKAAEISHYNLVAQHTLVWERFDASKPWTLSSLIALPTFHAATAPFVHTSVLRSGYVIHLMRRFDLDSFMKNIHIYRPTELIVAPPVVLRVVMSEKKGEYDFSCVKRAWAGAAPLDKDLQARFESLIGGPCTQVWGMTESCCIVSMTPYPEADLSGSVGTMLPNMDIKFIDDDGCDVTAPNTRGEMLVRGPIVIRGYFENPEANARDFDEEGYYRTGDIGYFEEDTARLFIVDRKKELIKVRGFQVAPNEIEGVLLGHEGIVDAAVIGLTVKSSPDAELVRAYVVLRGDTKLTEGEIVEFCGKKLASYKRLTGGVRFVEAIPKTASGKILKRFLRDQAMKELKAEGSKL